MEGQETGQNKSVKERLPTSPFPEYGKKFPKERLSFQHPECSRGR
jgi:hypothetical protein